MVFQIDQSEQRMGDVWPIRAQYQPCFMAATGFSLGEDSDEEVILFLFPFSSEKDSNLSDLCVLCQFDPDSDFGSTIIFLSVLLHPSGQYYFRHRVYFKMQHIRFIPFQKLFICYQKKTVSSNSAWLTSKSYLQRRESESSHWDTFGKV